MPKNNGDVPYFSFSHSDFKATTGKKKDARYLHRRFKDLLNAMKNTELYKQEFSDFKGYVSRGFNQGSKKHTDYMWLGIARSKYLRPQDEVQFQVRMVKNEPLHIEIFIDQAARNAKIKARDQILNNRLLFISKVHELLDCSIGCYGSSDIIRKKCRYLTDTDIDNITQQMGKGHVHFFIGQDIQENQAIKEQHLLLDILLVWLKLSTIYDILSPTNSEPHIFGKSTNINGTDTIINNIKKHFSTEKINENETEAEAAERESKRISYDMNWEAQERANSNHRKTVLLLARHIRNHGVKPMQSVIDTIAINGNKILIFEIKTIHSTNFIHQTRTAVGQLLGYEYFNVRANIEYSGKEINRAIVYNNKPTQEIIDFLRAYNFLVFWIERGRVTGESNSIQILDIFLSNNHLSSKSPVESGK
jgi:hypothetical protein